MLTSTPSHVRMDPVGGISGDMFAAAILDTWPELETALVAALEAAGMLRLASVRRVDHLDGVLSGSRFEVREVHSGEHSHRHYRDVQALLRSARLADPVRERALDIFERLARAESRVHGVELADVSFHEVGQWDSIADIVSAAWLIEALGDVAWSCEPLPLGRGRVATAHGLLPVPAPATVLLLEGLPIFQDEHPGERVTPTGAAIVRHLDPSFDPVPGARRLERSGTGFGSAVFDGFSNTLRLLAFGGAEGGYRSERILVCAFEVDDQTAEDLAVGLDRVRAVAGVLDVIQSPVFGKKGRLAVRVQLLVEPDALQRALDACFDETTTLGVRYQVVERAVLERDELEVAIEGRRLSVKRARRGAASDGRVTAKASMDDLASAEGGRAGRERLRRQVEESATASRAPEGRDAPAESGADGDRSGRD